MDRPRVTVVAGIWAIQAVWSIGSALVNLQNMGIPDDAMAVLFRLLLYGQIVVNGLLLVAVVLILGYRRIGLLLGGLLTILNFAGVGWFVLTESTITLFNVIPLFIDALILYYVYQYLTHVPEKRAFR